jgi:hypothetical protein
MLADGKTQSTGWVAAGTGLLAINETGNGYITSGAELLGAETVLPDGKKAATGYAALAAFDSNHDGVINAKDKIWSSLGVLVDSTKPGAAAGTEVFESLTSLGITSLSLNAKQTNIDSNGNIITQESTYTLENGTQRQMGDVDFQVNTIDSKAAPVDLRTNVASMAKLLSSYAHDDESRSTETPKAPTDQVVTKMATTLAGFDANGLSLPKPSATILSAGESLAERALKSTDHILANPTIKRS